MNPDDQIYKAEDEELLSGGREMLHEGSADEATIGITKITCDRIIRLAKPDCNAGDALALYCFYCYTIKWQHTTEIYCNSTFASNGLDWSIPRFRKAKAFLLKIGLIKNIQCRVEEGPEKGQIMKHYIKVQYASLRETLHSKSHPVEKLPGGFITTNTEVLVVNSEELKTKKHSNVWEAKIPEPLNTPKFLAAWDDWLRYRHERRLSSYVPRSVGKLMAQFCQWGVDAAVAGIEASIANGWQGVFQPKKISAGGTITQTLKEIQGLRDQIENLGWGYLNEPAEDKARREAKRKMFADEIKRLEATMGGPK